MLGTEFQESLTLWDWIKLNKLAKYCFHIPNEAKRSAYTGNRLKKIGLRPGVSDYFIGIPKGEWAGMFLEMKAGKNKPTKLQEQFMEDMAEQGYYCVWVTGFDNAKQCIERYLSLNP